MPFLNRLGFRRRNSKATPPGDSSDGEVDLDVFNPFEQSDMGITSDGKPISSFSSGSAYTIVDSPCLTMDDFLKRAPHPAADGRRPEAHRAVTIDPAADRPRENRAMFSSEPELRRVAAANSLHRRYRAQTVTTIDLDRSNSNATEEHADISQQEQPFPEQHTSSREYSDARPDSLPEDETLECSRFSFEYASRNISQRSLSLGSPKSRSPGPRAMTPLEPSFQSIPATSIDEDENISAFSNLQNHASITAPIPSFQRVAGYKFELSEGSMRSTIRRDELLSIPSRPSSTIIRHPDPPRTPKRHGIMPMTNHVPEPTLKRSIEVAYMRKTSNAVDAKIKKEDPKIRQECMLNAAIKRWSFWGSLNRVGDVGPKQHRLNLDDSSDLSIKESDHSDDEDRTAVFRSIEYADQQTRSRILDNHLEQIIEAATVDIKDKDVRRTVQIVDGEVRRVYSRRGLIESAREEVRISVCSSEPPSETIFQGRKEQEEE
ncbi:hypothetical protein DL98DRAFT_594992 [Cadophora sp. DSE1049]|nr:hypothetical protein DL98DRAFT_594992 [Cadophora sp. DSE1049]